MTKIPAPSVLANELVEVVTFEEAPMVQGATFTARDLRNMRFPELKYILPGLIPEGLTLLASRPKFGKSWLVLDIAIAVAFNRFVLGTLKPTAGDVLYLALEDGPRRLQRRMSKLLPTFNTEWSPRLTFATEWPRAEDGIAKIEEWIAKANAPRLINIDTLAQFRAPARSKQSIYELDYAALSGLQRLASKHGICIIVVHHDRKNEAEDAFDTVSGSLGLTAAADTILILKRQSGNVTLYARGRDIEESETALQLDKTTCRWAILGAAAEVNRSAQRSRVITAIKEAGGELGPKDIQIAAEIRTRNAVDVLLRKMVQADELIRTKRGRYALSPTDASKIGQKERFDTQPTENKEEPTNLSNLTDLSAEQSSVENHTVPDNANPCAIPSNSRRSPADGNGHDGSP
jgi:hypothetical protein